MIKFLSELVVVFNLGHWQSSETLEPLFNCARFDMAETVSKKEVPRFISWKIRSTAFRFPWHSVWIRSLARWSAASKYFALSTRKTAVSTSRFCRNSLRKISVKAGVVVENRRRWSTLFVCGFAAASSQNCWSLIRITVSSTAIWFGDLPLTGCKPAFCAQSWTTSRDRWTPKLSRINIVFTRGRPVLYIWIFSLMTRSGVRSRSTKSKLIQPLLRLRRVISAMDRRNHIRFTFHR